MVGPLAPRRGPGRRRPDRANDARWGLAHTEGFGAHGGGPETITPENRQQSKREGRKFGSFQDNIREIPRSFPLPIFWLVHARLEGLKRPVPINRRATDGTMPVRHAEHDEAAGSPEGSASPRCAWTRRPEGAPRRLPPAEPGHDPRFDRTGHGDAGPLPAASGTAGPAGPGGPCPARCGGQGPGAARLLRAPIAAGDIIGPIGGTAPADPLRRPPARKGGRLASGMGPARTRSRVAAIRSAAMRAVAGQAPRPARARVSGPRRP